MDVVEWIEDSQEGVSFVEPTPPKAVGFHSITPAEVKPGDFTWTPSTRLALPVEPPPDRTLTPNQQFLILTLFVFTQ